MFFLAVAFVGSFVHWLFRRKNGLELLLLYLMFCSFGLSGIGDFAVLNLYSNEAAQLLGWAAGSPLQFEVAIANLSFGILAILSVWLRGAFLLAALIGNTIWFWGDAIGHIFHWIKAGHFPPNYSGAYFWADLFVPIFIGTIYLLNKRRATL